MGQSISENFPFSIRAAVFTGIILCGVERINDIYGTKEPVITIVTVK